MRSESWKEWHKKQDKDEFEKSKAKAISDANNVSDDKQRAGMLRIANKMKFQFDTKGLMNYGNCSKLNKPVTFMPGICQIETQQCFKHRRE